MARASWLALLLACTPTDPARERATPAAAPAPVVAPAAAPAPVATPDVPVPVPTRWTFSSEFSGCKISTASMLGDDFLWPAWRPCESGNCRTMTFELARGEYLEFSGDETASSSMVALSRDLDGQIVVDIRPLDGPAALAFMIEGPRRVGPRKAYGVSDVQVTADTAVFVLDGGDATALFLGPLHEDPAWRAPFMPLEKSQGFLLQGRTLTVTMGTEIQRTGSDDRTLAPLLAAREGRKIGWISGVGDAVVFGSDERGDGVHIVRPGRAPRQLFEIGKDQVVGTVVADGDQLYWAVGDIVGPPVENLLEIATLWNFAEVQLWTAKLPADGAPLVKRRVGELHNGGEYWLPSLYARRGRVAYATRGEDDRRFRSDIHVLDANIGESMRPVVPDSIHLAGVVMLGERELVVSQQSPTDRRINGLVRFRLPPAH